MALVVSVMTHFSLYRYLIWTFAGRKTRHYYVLDYKTEDEEINSDVCQLGTRDVVSPLCVCVCVCVFSALKDVQYVQSVYLYMRECPCECQARNTVAKDK